MGRDLKKIQSIMINYFDKVIETYANFKESLNYYFENGIENKTEEMFEKVGELENEADTIRREIIKKILEGGLLPTTSENFLKIIEMTDKIANRSEKVIDKILLIKIDSEILNVDTCKEILNLTKIQLGKLKDSFLNIFIDFDKAFDLAKSLELEEAEIDSLEKNYIKELMRKDVELSKKIYYRDFINMLANISDIIEDVGDEIEKITVIRKV